MKGIWSFSDDALLARDREFAKAAAKLGAHAAFVSYAAPEVRLYRDGKFPLLGPELAPAVLPSGANVWTWEPAFASVSRLKRSRLHVWHLQDRSGRANRGRLSRPETIFGFGKRKAATGRSYSI